ncbi:hypothetical protein BIV57_02940 [Mangrovactinospora gilvigrisea]|uniref:Uncharacterized protein n=1 Tax=Mangrovactinospora gilvigrisea TaxID=1428644 RepID=A0A1J7BZM4_9ACTN|nr:hypothetical protein [Mangrovactinospora gilvigrisea]OIV38937.1 hypothetical protein BIV57_02940 [Mangrovactinospora gilvigrisea]
MTHNTAQGGPEQGRRPYGAVRLAAPLPAARPSPARPATGPRPSAGDARFGPEVALPLLSISSLRRPI